MPQTDAPIPPETECDAPTVGPTGAPAAALDGAHPAPPVDDAQLRDLVAGFYAEIRRDPELGPLFDRVTEWDHHIDRITDFWSSIVLKSGRYKGNPFAAHHPFADRLEPAHFARWLGHWHRATEARFAPPVARLLQEKAGRIAESLEAGLVFARRPGPAAGKPPPRPPG